MISKNYPVSSSKARNHISEDLSVQSKFPGGACLVTQNPRTPKAFASNLAHYLITPVITILDPS